MKLKIKNGQMIVGKWVFELGSKVWVTAIYEKTMANSDPKERPYKTSDTILRVPKAIARRAAVVVGFRQIATKWSIKDPAPQDRTLSAFYGQPDHTGEYPDAPSACIDEQQWTILVCFHPLLKPVYAPVENVMTDGMWQCACANDPKWKWRLVKNPKAREAAKKYFAEHPSHRGGMGRFV